MIIKNKKIKDVINDLKITRNMFSYNVVNDSFLQNFVYGEFRLSLGKLSIVINEGCLALKYSDRNRKEDIYHFISVDYKNKKLWNKIHMLYQTKSTEKFYTHIPTRIMSLINGWVQNSLLKCLSQQELIELQKLRSL